MADKENWPTKSPLGHNQEINSPVNILAIIQAFGDRPDILLEMLERYDPGIIKRLNESTLETQKQDRLRLSRFSQISAFTVLYCRVALAVLAFCLSLFFAWDERGIALSILFFVASIIFLTGDQAFQAVCEAVINRLKKRDK